jgi:hypothetical protein
MQKFALWISLLGLSAPVLAFESTEKAADAAAAEETEEEVPEWDIEAAHGPRFTWETTLTEGTWISVDVHPRGNQIGRAHV